MVQEILKGLAQAAVGLHPAFMHLVLQPDLKLFHDRPTVGLMVGQTRGRCQPPLARGRLVLEYPVEIIDHPLTSRGKNVLNLGKLAPPMRQAVAANDLPSSASALAESASDI